MNYCQVNFGQVTFGPATDRQNVIHMSPPCISTGVLKNCCIVLLCTKSKHQTSAYNSIRVKLEKKFPPSEFNDFRFEFLVMFLNHDNFLPEIMLNYLLFLPSLIQTAPQPLKYMTTQH